MKHQDITAEEWRVAHHYLDNAENGTKLPFTYFLDQDQTEQLAKKFKHTKPEYKSYHSFIKLNGKIYAVAQGKGPDAKTQNGTICTTKYAYDEQGQLYILKISTSSELGEEYSKLVDIDLAKGSEKRKDSEKNYVVLEHVGQDLKQFMKENHDKLTAEERLDMACQSGLALFNLHTGFSSVTKTPYAHLDLKNDNMTIDSQKKCHVIDLGFAEENPHDKADLKSGAVYYQPHGYKRAELTKAECDVFAFKRILYKPSWFYCSKGFFEAVKVEEGLHPNKSILTDEILDEYQLREFVDTGREKYSANPEYKKSDFELHTMLANFINARYNLKITKKEMQENPMLAYALIYLYQNNKVDEFDQIKSDPVKLKLVGALTKLGKHEKIESYMEDSIFIEKLKIAETEEKIMALVLLKENGKNDYYDKVLESQVISKLINVLVSSGKFDDLSKYLESEFLQLLEQSTAQSKYLEWIGEPSLKYEDIMRILKQPKFVETLQAGYEDMPYKKQGEISKRMYELKSIQCPSFIEAMKCIDSMDEYKYYGYDLALQMPKLAELHFQMIKILYAEKMLTSDLLTNAIVYKNVDVGVAEAIINLNKQGLLPKITSTNIIKMVELSKNSNLLTKEMVQNEGFINFLVNRPSEEEMKSACRIYKINPELHMHNISELMTNQQLNAIFLQLEGAGITVDKHREYYQKLLAKPEFVDALITFQEDWNEENLSFLFDNMEVIIKYRAPTDRLNMRMAHAFTFFDRHGITNLDDNHFYIEFIGTALQLKVKVTLIKEAIDNNVNLSACLDCLGYEPKPQAQERVLQILIRAKKLKARDEDVSTYLNSHSGAPFLFEMNLENKDYMNAVCDLYQAIKELQQSGSSTQDKTAEQAVGRIRQVLDKVVNQDLKAAYPSDENPLEAFAQEVKSTINKAKPALAKHDNLLGVLDKVLTAVASLVIFYPLTRHVMEKHNRYNLFFHTANEKRADNIEEALNKMPKGKS